MAMRAGRPVTAGLSQVARMDPRERARTVRELCRNQPAFRSLLTRVSVARGVAFASGLVLALAIVLLVQGVPSGWVSLLVLVGLVGFASVAVVLTDSRFDLLLAVIGAHRTDELHDRLVVDEVYGDGTTTGQEQVVPTDKRPPHSKAGRAAPRDRGGAPG